MTWMNPIIPAITLNRTAIRGTLALTLLFLEAEVCRFAQMMNSALHARPRRERNGALIGVRGGEIRVWASLEAEIVLLDKFRDIEEQFSEGSVVIT